jgi:hypothetical protein
VEDLSSDVGVFQFAGYPVGLGTPQAGDFAPRQELSWEDSTQELPPHSFAVEGDTTVIPNAPQESVLTAVGSVVGGALKQAVVQPRPQLPPADFFRPRKPRPTIPCKKRDQPSLSKRRDQCLEAGKTQSYIKKNNVRRNLSNVDLQKWSSQLVTVNNPRTQTFGGIQPLPRVRLYRPRQPPRTYRRHLQPPRMHRWLRKPLWRKIEMHF